MGVYSELDIERRYGNNPFEECDVPSSVKLQDVPAFAEPGHAEPAAAPSTTEVTVPQSQAEVKDAALAPSASEQAVDAAPAEASDNTGQTAEVEGGTENEDDKKKAHEAAEAKRKAEFDARQAAKKAAEQEQLAKLETMSEEELLTASMKRVSADTEKLTRRNMKECVAEHIQTMCIEDPGFARKVMHPRKSMIRCFQYISRKAWDYVQDELKANGIQPGQGRQGYGCDVPDDLCYQWAVDYFNDPDAKEDHEDEEKFVPKPYYGGASKSKSGKTAKGKTGDKKADTDKKAAAKAPAKKPAEPTGQISLGDFAIPEEKAG
ncbi:MAG: Cas9 inhibitor AcrIIA9 family protein [Dysosmobacter sp.]|nr:Cas9 inhibitor AcrIIA9 family protein [Dysosmobacter sp.]